ncbi:hypothetical protein [Methylomonas sp. 11b]|uniref:hypothetical protein n=1 Tax=Methylomonas sp. 11b TaxID=1168169 RepID=UPI00047CD2F2|nr:hypothetical protein [Methylomonas sp. 11b]
MTSLERAGLQSRIQMLRECATLLRNAANHADSRAAYNEDMAAAANADNEADELAAQLQDAQP